MWSVDAEDVEPDTSSGVDQSCLVSEEVDSCVAAHLKYSDSNKQVNKASDTIQDGGKYHTIITLAIIIWLSHMALLGLPERLHFVSLCTVCPTHLCS